MEALHITSCAERSHAWSQAAANLYIPRSAGADGASKWDAGKAEATPVSAPASDTDQKVSPFEGVKISGDTMKIPGDTQKPDKASQEVCGAILHLNCGLGRTTGQGHTISTRQGTKMSQSPVLGQELQGEQVGVTIAIREEQSEGSLNSTIGPYLSGYVKLQ